MKPVAQLDFLAHPPRPWAGVALSSATALLLVTAALSCWQLEQSNRQDTALLNQRSARLLPPPPRKLSETERVRLAQAERVSGELRAPWSDVLAAFDEHGQPDIGLLKLEPDAKAGVVRVTGHARNTSSLFAYLKGLEADPRLVQVALTTHQTERDTPGQPVRFIIQAGWLAAPGAAPGKAVS